MSYLLRTDRRGITRWMSCSSRRGDLLVKSSVSISLLPVVKVYGVRRHGLLKRRKGARHTVTPDLPSAVQIIWGDAERGPNPKGI